MKACSTETRISKPVIKISIGNDKNNAPPKPKPPAAHIVADKTAKVTSNKCPATMLAQSRTASEKGRTTNVDTNSIGVTMRYRNFGTPGGNNEFLR